MYKSILFAFFSLFLFNENAFSQANYIQSCSQNLQTKIVTWNNASSQCNGPNSNPNLLIFNGSGKKSVVYDGVTDEVLDVYYTALALYSTASNSGDCGYTIFDRDVFQDDVVEITNSCEIRCDFEQQIWVEHNDTPGTIIPHYDLSEYERRFFFNMPACECPSKGF